MIIRRYINGKRIDVTVNPNVQPVPTSPSPPINNPTPPPTAPQPVKSGCGCGKKRT